MTDTLPLWSEHHKPDRVYPPLQVEGYTEAYHKITGDRGFIADDGKLYKEIVPVSPGAETHGFGWGYLIFDSVSGEAIAESHNEAYASPMDAAKAVADVLEAERVG